MRPFEFWASAGQVKTAMELREFGREAEDRGYTGVIVNDHLWDQIAPIPAMMVLADATKRLRVGTFVLNNDLRHPVVLAQELASVDVLSGGRLTIGIGAGWNENEYAAIGMPFDRPSVRIARMAESIEIMRGLFGPEKFSFSGEHYSITEFDAKPKPLQTPPPILVGAGGPRILSVAARLADIVSLAPVIKGYRRIVMGSIVRDGVATKVEVVRAAAGERFKDLVLNVYPLFARPIVTDDPVSVADRLLVKNADICEGLSAKELLESPSVFVGTVDSLTERIQRDREEFGITSFGLGPLGPISQVVERLAS